MFAPLHTGRLVVRAPRPEDVEALWAWRNEPEVAALQAWSLPFPRREAQQRIDRAIESGGPVDDVWWTAIIEDAATGEPVGEVGIRLTHARRAAELGFTLARRHWGRGFAVEALGAVIAHLFDTEPLTRAWGSMHPHNRASAMVLERCGLLFEGHTRLSFWVGDDNSDDWIYGITREDWEAWRDRERSIPAHVRLVPITPDNAAAVRALRTHHTQRSFVSPVLDSFADALVPELVDGVAAVPWLRAIEADGLITGFVMLALPDPVHRSPYLWRLLVDRLHQRRGIGGRALDLVVAECLGWGVPELTTSWSEGKGSPRPFYLRHGFAPTGRIIDGETEGRRSIV